MPTSKQRRPLISLSPERRNELWGVFLSALSILLFMALISYHPDDLAFFTSNPNPQVRNLCGVAGAFIAALSRSVVGLSSYLLVLLGFLWAAARFSGNPPQRLPIKAVSTILFLVAASGLLSIVWVQTPEARVHRGGIAGLWVGDRMVHYCGWWGAAVIFLTLGALSLILATELAVWPLVGGLFKGFSSLGALLKSSASALQEKIASRREQVLHRAPRPKAKPKEPTEPIVKVSGPSPATKTREVPAQVKSVSPARPEHLPGRAESSPLRESVSPASQDDRSGRADTDRASFQLPSLDLLDPPSKSPQVSLGKEWAQKNAKVLEESLRDFGIDAKVAEVEVGPVITRYELELSPGVKVQKITTLSDDLSLALKAPSIRMIAPIPGKARVGIEVPNPASSLVTLREVLESKEYQELPSKLALTIGKDAAGHPLVADLSDMPHLLIAGTTGSGKTVCVNTLISSILFRATPEEVRFLMVDPKMVELSVFNGLPHLLFPVLTEPKKVPKALEWVIQEMETRYRLFAKLGIRNIEGYHERAARGELPTQEIPDSLPYLIVIIDELADLMLVAQAEAERAIARLAHLSRAVGIHMVLATQRPSVDVLTGVIKANFPARISFQVASKVDSRTVLDTIGAEKLLGKGDLLFMQPGSSKFIRAQGTLVTDEEIDRLVSFLKAQRPARYESVSFDEEAKQGVAGPALHDPLYPEAVRVVVETGQASVSLLQRRMRLGYGRAARILDRMEEEGIVGPIRGAKPREVFLKEVPEDVLNDRSASKIGA